MAGYGLASFILAPDDQHSHLVELHGVRSDALACLRWRLMPDAICGTGLLAQAARAGLDVVGDARRGIGKGVTAGCRRKKEQ